MPRVLIVDDKLENRYLLAALFKGHGYEVDQACHGAQALEIACVTPPHLIVTDILMPVMDGFTLCRLWKQNPRLSRIPFVFYTATYTEPRDREFALSLGAECFIIKPAEPDEFMRQIEDVLHLHRAGLLPGNPDPGEDEEHYLKEHNEVLIRKLEKKVDELNEAHRRKDEFLMMLAHELRNPLAPIGNAVAIMRCADPASPLFARQREVIERQVRHMARLIQDLLDTARLTHGIFTLSRERIDLREAVHLAVESVQPLLDGREDDLEIALPAEPLWVKGDLARLGQALGNLLNNAVKFSDPGRPIRLELTREAGAEYYASAPCACILVQDQGSGIAADLLPHLFDFFVQADKSLARSQGGLGIGLTLVKKIIDLHKGRIEAESLGEGRGSRFTIRLPLAEPE